MCAAKKVPELRAFLVERYWPGISQDQLDDAEDRIRRAVGDLARAGARIRLVSSTLIPADEVVLMQFDAASEDDVIEASRRSRVRFDRMQPAQVSRHFEGRPR